MALQSLGLVFDVEMALCFHIHSCQSVVLFICLIIILFLWTVLEYILVFRVDQTIRLYYHII